MIALKINNKKEFMSKLLVSELFDCFFVEEASIDTYNTFHIDGRIHKDFYKNDADYDEKQDIPELSTWAELKQICFDLIKGKRTPLSFKFVFHAPSEIKKQMLLEADAGLMDDQVNLGLNIRFSNGDVIITTGTAFSIFTLDKSIEKAWDGYIPSFLEKSGVSLEIL